MFLPRLARLRPFLPLLIAMSAAAGAQTIDAFNPLPIVPPTSLALDADGRILVVGNFTMVGGQARDGVARLNADGSIDASFENPVVDLEVKTIAVQADGKLLIGGDFTEVGGQSRHGLARLMSNGSLDTTFADPNFDSTVWAIALQPDGRILAAGDFQHVGATARGYLARLGTNGALDTSFADPALCCLGARAVALQADGRVVVGGYFSQAAGTSHFYLARYSSAGVLDAAFPATEPPASVDAILVAPDGSFRIGGGYTAASGIRPASKLSADGTLDAAYGNLNDDGGTSSLALQPNGKLLVGGTFQTIGGQPRHALARLNADGTLDASFADLAFSFDATNPNGYVVAIAAQADGRIVAGGNFSLVAGQPRQFMARVVTGDFATHELVVQPVGSGVTATWYRLGDGPELALPPTLMHSSDGVTFTAIGAMTRVADGWQATAPYDVHGARFYLEAVGPAAVGATNGSLGGVGSEVYSSDTIFVGDFE